MGRQLGGGGEQVVDPPEPGWALWSRPAKRCRPTETCGSPRAEERSLGGFTPTPHRGGGARLAAQAQGGARARAAQGGGWARACGSARAGPGQLLPPSLRRCPSPLPFLSLSCPFRIGCQGPDVRADRWSGLGGRESSRIRLPILAHQLLWQQGKQPRGGKGSRGERCASVPPTSGQSPSPLRSRRSSLPPRFPPRALPVLGTRRPAFDLPHSLLALRSNLPPAKCHSISCSKQEANLRRLATAPRAPLPTIYPCPERWRLRESPASSPSSALRPPAHNFL